jgi:transketolase
MALNPIFPSLPCFVPFVNHLKEQGIPLGFKNRLIPLKRGLNSPKTTLEPTMQSTSQMSETELSQIAARLRIDILRMLTEAGSGHPGGSLSAIDIILTLYSGEMRYDSSNPHWAGRDRFVLSKGHGVPALYAVMAEKGFFEKEKLLSLRTLGSPLQGHPANALLPGIEASTGSLGQGLSVAQGIALAGKLQYKDTDEMPRVYALCGDGELQEGQIWEVALSAPHLGATNLTAFVDWNKAQIDGLVEDVMPLGDLKEKWAVFGWHVQHIDGHDYQAIRTALQNAREAQDRPSVIIADTIKGKGVSFMESDIVGWHGKAPSASELETAISELEQAAGGAQ